MDVVFYFRLTWVFITLQLELLLGPVKPNNLYRAKRGKKEDDAEEPVDWVTSIPSTGLPSKDFIYG
jgi:hypothetical protein